MRVKKKRREIHPPNELGIEAYDTLNRMGKNLTWLADECGIEVSYLTRLFRHSLKSPSWRAFQVCAKLGIEPEKVYMATAIDKLKNKGAEKAAKE